MHSSIAAKFFVWAPRLMSPTLCLQYKPFKELYMLGSLHIGSVTEIHSTRLFLDLHSEKHGFAKQTLSI